MDFLVLEWLASKHKTFSWIRFAYETLLLRLNGTMQFNQIIFMSKYLFIICFIGIACSAEKFLLQGKRTVLVEKSNYIYNLFKLVLPQIKKKTYIV